MNMLLTELLDTFVPGSFNQPWTWDDEENDILVRECCCCSMLCHDPQIGLPGHYQYQLERHIYEYGIPGAILLGNDGRVWDGHHRVVAARRLGFRKVPVQGWTEGIGV